MVAYACNPRTWEAEARRLRVQGQPRLYNEFKVSLGYMERPYLKNPPKSIY
jgi:hypothetical protein